MITNFCLFHILSLKSAINEFCKAPIRIITATGGHKKKIAKRISKGSCFFFVKFLPNKSVKLWHFSKIRQIDVMSLNWQNLTGVFASENSWIPWIIIKLWRVFLRLEVYQNFKLMGYCQIRQIRTSSDSEVRYEFSET